MPSVPSRPLTWLTALAVFALSLLPFVPAGPLSPDAAAAPAATSSTTSSSTTKKSATPSKKASTTKKAAPKSAATSKKATTTKKAAPKSAATTKKATTTKKAAPKKASTSKKAATTKKAAPKSAATTKKATTTKKAAPKKASTAKKAGTPTAKATSATKKRAAAKKAPAPVVFDPAKPSTLCAPSAVVLDRRTGGVVWGKNEDDPRPIASLTKLMTALVFLDYDVALTDSMTVTSEDIAGAGRSRVRAGNRVPVGDLLKCSLISSDNAASRTLARSTGLTIREFTAQMNRKAFELGLHSTHYAEVTGLDAANVSTALDQAKILDIVWADPTLVSIMQTETYSFRCSKRIETLTNTNRLLRTRSDIAGGKTGFIRPAGYCLATHVGDRTDPHLTTVVLGAASNSSRFSESAKLIDWALKRTGPLDAAAPATHRR